MAANEVSCHQHAVTEFPVNKNNSAQTPLTDFVMSMESPAWVPILQRQQLGIQLSAWQWMTKNHCHHRMNKQKF
jgi:hypothetical protein